MRALIVLTVVNGLCGATRAAAPVAVDDSPAAIPEDSPAQVFNVLENDTDADNIAAAANANLVIADASLTSIPVTTGTLEIVEDRHAIRFTPAANFAGTVRFDYVVTDGSGKDTGSVTVVVTPANDAPSPVNDAPPSINEDTVSMTIDVLANDIDIDNQGVPANAGLTLVAGGLSPILPTMGTLTIASPTTVIFAPKRNFFGTVTFTYQVTDGTAVSTGSVTIVVNAVVDGPVAMNDSPSLNGNGATKNILVLANDTDADNLTGPKNAGLTIVPGSLSSLSPKKGTIAIAADNLSVNFTAAPDFSGDVTFTYRVTDGTLEAEATVSFKYQYSPDYLNDSWEEGVTLQFFGGGSANVTANEALAVGEGTVPTSSNTAKTGLRLELVLPIPLLCPDLKDPSMWMNADDAMFFVVHATGSLGTVQSIELTPVGSTNGSDDVDPRSFAPFWRSLHDASIGGLGGKTFLGGGYQWVSFSDFRARLALGGDVMFRHLEWTRTLADETKDAFSVYSAIVNVGLNPSFEYRSKRDATTRLVVNAEAFLGKTWRGFLGTVIDNGLGEEFLGTDENWFEGWVAQGSVRINGVGFFISAPLLTNHENEFQLIGGVVIDEAVITVSSDYDSRRTGVPSAATEEDAEEDSDGIAITANAMSAGGAN